MYYVYLLKSRVENKTYIGYTNNLRRRIEEHRKGKSFSTKFRRPFTLIYFEGCTDEADARRREYYLKTTQGRRFIGLRLLEYVRRKKRRLASGS